jgi:hypothetical protein
MTAVSAPEATRARQAGLRVALGGRRQDAVDRRDRHRRKQERDVDQRLPEQRLLVVGRRVDEGLEEVDRRDPDDRGGELDLEHRGVDVRQPFRLVRVILEVHPRHERLVAADDDHDQQVGDHHHVDQPQHHQHDHRLGQRFHRHGGLTRRRGREQDLLDRRLVAERRLDQVREFDPEVPDVDGLGND